MNIKVIQGDITKLGSEIDCIVNAANESLRGGGGVDGAIHKAAGPELDRECRQLGGCHTGDAKATRAYRLKQKYIIHTVGPDYRFDNNCAEKLRSAYQRSLEVADSLGCQTIAFPSISTGIFEYPLEEATKICAKTVFAFEGKNLKQAYMVIRHGQDRIDAYAKAFAEEEAKRSK